MDGCDLALTIDLGLALRDNLRVPDDLQQAEASIHSAWTYRYLLDLVEDMREALRGVAVSSACKGWSGPALRLEARVVGDLTMGRTGVVRPCSQASSHDYKRLALSACDSLTRRVLPELRQVIRELSHHRGVRLAPGFSGNEEAGGRLPFVESAAMTAESETLP